MNILMLLQDRYFPPDIRVEKEARALLSAGHEIFLLSQGKKEMPLVEAVNGINVIRVLPSEKFLNRMHNFLWFDVFFTDIFWKKALKNTVKQYNIDVLHVHDLPMVKTALSVSKEFGIPLIADLHENYPEGIKAWRKVKTSLKNKFFVLFSPVWRWKRLEKKVLQDVDRIITVVDEAKDHYIDDCKMPFKKITVVMNSEDLKKFDSMRIDESLIREYRTNFVISYVGGFGPHRGIDTAIKSMPNILKEIPNAKLLLVGKGPTEYKKELDRLCKDLEIENNIIFTGWTDFSSVPSYIFLSDICLVPHHASGHTNTTIPHKLFQYMAMKKPIIVTDCKPLKRIVKEAKCGIVVPSGDYCGMAKAVIKLYKDKGLANKFGKNGRKAVEKKYNWKNDTKKLIELYNGLKKCKK